MRLSQTHLDSTQLEKSFIQASTILFALIFLEKLWGFVIFPSLRKTDRDSRRFPAHQEVLRYLEDYACEFGLNELIHCQTEVRHVALETDGKWIVKYRIGGDEGSEVAETYDAVVSAMDISQNQKSLIIFLVDSILAALNAVGFKDIDIVIGETGWPYCGNSNEIGPSIENAKAYNEGLDSHLRCMSGTPLMPGKPVDTYIFALYDEDLKPDPIFEKFLGLYKPDLTMTYDINFSTGSRQV